MPDFSLWFWWVIVKHIICCLIFRQYSHQSSHKENLWPPVMIPLFLMSWYSCSSCHDAFVPSVMIPMFLLSGYLCSSCQDTSVPHVMIHLFLTSWYTCSSFHDISVPPVMIPLFVLSWYLCSSCHDTSVPLIMISLHLLTSHSFVHLDHTANYIATTLPLCWVSPVGEPSTAAAWWS